MTRRRWIADEFTATTAALTGSNAAHLARVLRARPGQQFDIAAGANVRLGTVRAVADDRVEFDLTDVLAAPQTPEVTLVLAVFKFDRMEWAIEKAVELGVKQIFPVTAARSEKHLAAAAAKRAERWRRIAKEAAQQSRRGAPPEIVQPVRLPQALGLGPQPRILLSEEERAVTLAVALRASQACTLAIGPEGGWTADELAAFAQAGWIAATLGNTILRAETAAIAALAIAISTLSSSSTLQGEEK